MQATAWKLCGCHEGFHKQKQAEKWVGRGVGSPVMAGDEINPHPALTQCIHVWKHYIVFHVCEVLCPSKMKNKYKN
jgi:hypothetical protein